MASENTPILDFRDFEDFYGWLAEHHAKAPPTFPPPCAELLVADEEVKALFGALPPSHQRQYAQWVGAAKQGETRLRRTRVSSVPPVAD